MKISYDDKYMILLIKYNSNNYYTQAVIILSIINDNECYENDVDNNSKITHDDSITDLMILMITIPTLMLMFIMTISVIITMSRIMMVTIMKSKCGKAVITPIIIMKISHNDNNNIMSKNNNEKKNINKNSTSIINNNTIV